MLQRGWLRDSGYPICYDLPLFATVRHYSHYSRLFALFAIRYSGLFAVRYSRLFAIRYSGFPDTHAQRMPKLCSRLLPTFKAWLLSTRSFCFNGELYGVFWSDNLEKSDQQSILRWRCHKFKRKRRYYNWNFAFSRLECERWQQLLRWYFETLVVCRSLFFFYSNTTLLDLQTLLFLFFSKICASKLVVRIYLIIQVPKS